MTRPRFQEAASPRLKAKFSPYVKRAKLPGEAPPLAVPVMSKDWPSYEPVRVVPVRAGAENFLLCQSRGV